MKLKILFFLLALGVVAATCSLSKVQSTSTDLMACCDPATDPDCAPPPPPPPPTDGDSMPTRILG